MQQHTVADSSRRYPISGNKHIQTADSHVARRIRERRILMGLTRKQIATKTGAVQQQISKYEHALDRITAGLLYQIAQALEVDVDYFFEGLDETGSDEQTELKTRTLELARLFMNVRDVRQREALVTIARALAHAEVDAVTEDDAPG